MLEYRVQIHHVLVNVAYLRLHPDRLQILARVKKYRVTYTACKVLPRLHVFVKVT